ncbi:DUF4234 domain-containing protein [Gilliamella sp. B2838]|uniref:DUF4234 domain-containing protein n=1 Tax=Gilliamella sp. B2838 TaxID=2818020 RepID=UPI003A5D09D4|nr:DUF4234 domain-containing protein [Gilliamella sp. B2838]
MRDIDLLKQENNLKTFTFILLSIVTLGVYDLLWIYNTNKSINRFTGMKVVSNFFVVVLLSFTAWSWLFACYTDIPYFPFLNTIFSLISFIMTIVWSNAAKNALIYHCMGKYNLKLKTNNFYIVIFNVLYINYIINSLDNSNRTLNNQR